MNLQSQARQPGYQVGDTLGAGDHAATFRGTRENCRWGTQQRTF
jgi:hypothetical protein